MLHLVTLHLVTLHLVTYLQTEAFMCGVKMEGVKLEEAKVDSLHWGVAEDGDTAQHYHGDSDKLLEYLRNKAQQRAELFE